MSLYEYVGVSRQRGRDRFSGDNDLGGISGHRHVMFGELLVHHRSQQRQMVNNGKKEHCTGREEFQSHSIKI